MSDLYHPCQVLADVLTLKERFGDLAGLKLAFCGDGNNVAHSLMLTCARLGIDFAIATPRGYEPNPEIVAQADGLAAVSGSRLQLTGDPAEAVDGAHAVYTDVWTSMGQEKEAAKRRKAFAGYQVNDALFALARPGRRLHALPARAPRRGSHRFRHRAQPLGGFRSGRKPPARAEGAAAHDDGIIALYI